MKIMRFFAAVAAVVVLLSATSTLSARIEKYVERVEKNCAQWTPKEWEDSKEQYKKLINEYKQNYDSLTPADRESINKAIGRYNGLYVKFSIGEAGDKLHKIGERIPSLVEGFVSAFDEK